MFHAVTTALATVVILSAHPADATQQLRTNASDDKVKVFGIGLSKTGTTSMTEAMESLGYKTIHGDMSLAPFMHHSDGVVDLAGYYDDVDSVWDIPTGAYYRELLDAYPDAKFVLTTRDAGSWYTSFVSFLDEYMYYQWGCEVPERVQRLHEFVYGTRLPNEEVWKTSFQQHNDAVQAYFGEHAPGQLLVLDVTEDNKWDKLCTFLGSVDGPCSPLNAGAAFPHTNNAAYNNVKKTCPGGLVEDDTHPLPLQGKQAYATLLCDPANESQAEYVRMLLVLKESIRQFDTDNDIVVMVYGAIEKEQYELLEREGFKVVGVSDVGSQVTDAEPRRVPDDISACYRAKLNVLQLTPYDKVIFLDSDVMLKEDVQFMFKSKDFIAFEGYESPLNAGLFAVTPSRQAFVDVHDILRSDSFHPADGWMAYGPFPHWRNDGEMSDWSFWCAHTDQGILYYYFDKVTMQATILSFEDGKDLFVHFTGWSKPSLHKQKDDLMKTAGSGSFSQWYGLWDRVEERLNDKGFDSNKLASTSPEVTKSRILRTLQSDPYSPYGPPSDECDPMDPLSLYLYNADTDEPIMPLGEKIDICTYTSALTIVATPSCKEKIKFKLLDAEGTLIQKNTEKVPPMTLGGDEGDDLDAVPSLSMPGDYMLQVNPAPGEKVSYEFTVGC